MTLLAIDTSTKAMGLALYVEDRVLYECVWHSENYHTVELAPAIQKALKQVGLEASAIEAVGIAIGPGSYTGLRIGLAVAKGIAFLNRLPIIAVSTLDLVAAGQPLQDLPLLAVLQAGRSRLAVARYRAGDATWQPDGEPELLTAEELSALIDKPTLICGELSVAERKLLGRKRRNAILASPAWSQRRPALLAEIAWERWQAGDSLLQAGEGPRYLQTQEALPA